MYNTRVLIGTQEFPKTKYNVLSDHHLFSSVGVTSPKLNITRTKSYFYGIKPGFLLYVLNALSDHHHLFSVGVT